jgi:hypothetical protein
MVFQRFLGRHRSLPPGLRPNLEPGERVVAWAPVPPAAAVVATDRGVHLPGRAGRLGWHDIHRAAWTGRELVVTPATLVEVRDRYLVVADALAVSVALPDPGGVPDEVRTRVTRSVSFSSHHRVPGGGARVVARRTPGADGLTWAVRYDDGTDPHGPGVAEATGRLVDMLVAAAHDPSL